MQYDVPVFAATVNTPEETFAHDKGYMLNTTAHVLTAIPISVARLKTISSKVTLPKQPRSCWGCGHDYLELGRWKDEDLGPHPTEEGFVLCPDCLEEIGAPE